MEKTYQNDEQSAKGEEYAGVEAEELDGAESGQNDGDGSGKVLGDVVGVFDADGHRQTAHRVPEGRQPNHRVPAEHEAMLRNLGTVL